MKKLITTLTVSLALTAVTIHFSYNASALDRNATQSLDSIVQQLNSFSDYTIHLSGHTDNIGSYNYNEKLSEQRVIAVRNYLIANSIDSTKIKYEVYGERKPAVPNTSDSNRALNRRVELTISGQKIDTSFSQATLKTELQGKDTIKPSVQDNIVAAPYKKVFEKKKSKRRLLWTGWKTGFHWSTAGKKEK